jgi:hypothetical protein
MKKLLICLAAFALTAAAQDKKLMHCFAFTQIDAATPADWEAFAKATDELPTKVPGLSKVWHGKLARPMSITQLDGQVDPEARKKLTAGETVTLPVKVLRRQHGVCMEFAGQDALKAYAKHPAHDVWMKSYEKVRVAGTTTIDILP